MHIADKIQNNFVNQPPKRLGNPIMLENIIGGYMENWESENKNRIEEKC
jgi:hypothetical protein